MWTSFAFSIVMLAARHEGETTDRCVSAPAIALVAGTGASAVVGAGGVMMLLSMSGALPASVAVPLSFATLPIAVGLLVAVPSIAAATCDDVAPSAHAFPALIGYLAGGAAGLVVGAATGSLGGALALGIRSGVGSYAIPPWVEAGMVGAVGGAFVLAPFGAGAMTWWVHPSDPHDGAE
jgi:hypothetical protein